MRHAWNLVQEIKQQPNTLRDKITSSSPIDVSKPLTNIVWVSPLPTFGNESFLLLQFFFKKIDWSEDGIQKDTDKDNKRSSSNKRKRSFCLTKPINLMAKKSCGSAGQTQLSSNKPNGLCQICRATSQCKKMAERKIIKMTKGVFHKYLLLEEYAPFSRAKSSLT